MLTGRLPHISARRRSALPKPFWRIAPVPTSPHRDVNVALRGAETVLSRIAQILGEPEDAFLDGATTGSTLVETSALLRVWDRLESAADRRKLLAFARRLADRG
jgi:hypothetical protein